MIMPLRFEEKKGCRNAAFIFNFQLAPPNSQLKPHSQRQHHLMTVIGNSRWSVRIDGIVFIHHERIQIRFIGIIFVRQISIEQAATVT